KGASSFRAVMGHALRNAMIPVVTYGATDVAALFGGVVVLEDVFGYAGMGQMAVQAINQLDIPLIMGTVLFAAVFVVLFNLIVDVLYGFIDPRITY
ncbi:MAG: ABC transporter permease, partial [Firmicutes bacterium]|nr:ABC transporter permease [Bacillota bacterium]